MHTPSFAAASTIIIGGSRLNRKGCGDPCRNRGGNITV